MRLPGRRWLVAVGLVELVLGACASTPRCPEEGGPVWREVTTEHFRVYTDLDSWDAGEAALELERLRGGLLAALGMKEGPPGVIQAIVFAEPEALHSFGIPYTGIFSTAGNPLIVMSSEYRSPTGRRFEVHAHELTHYLGKYRYLRLPRWVNEGLAGYFQTIEVSRDGTTATVGKASVSWTDVLSFRDLWNWDLERPAPEKEWGLYHSALVWMHYLQNEQGARLDAFLERLARAEDPKHAWLMAFDGVSPEALEREVAQYSSKSWSVRTVAVPSVPNRVRETLLPPAAVHMAFAILWCHSYEDRKESNRNALREVAEVLRHDPNHLGGLLEDQRVGSPEVRLEKARALTERFPEDATSWLRRSQAASAKGLRDESSMALERARTTAKDDDALLLNNIAWELLKASRVDEAFPLAKKAVELAPWRPGVIDTWAAALAGKGRCEEAIQAQERAVSWVSPGEDARGLEERLERYRSECKPVPVTESQHPDR